MLAVDRAGSGIPLVFIHAFPLSKKMWEGTKKKLSRNFQFLSIDLPGFGESPSFSENHSMDLMALEVLKTLDALGIKDKAVFCGVSMGGYVLFQLFKKSPERFRGLALVSTRSSADSAEAKEGRMKAIELIKGGGIKTFSETMVSKLFGSDTLKTQQSMVAQWQQSIQQANPDAVTAALKGMADRSDSTDLLELIKVPTVVFSGDQDTVVPPAEMRQMADKISSSRFESIEKAGHLLPLEQPEDFESKFLHYLKRKIL